MHVLCVRPEACACTCSASALPGPCPRPRARPPTQATAVLGHLEELRSLLTQSSWEVVSPFPIMLHVLLFFLRCTVPSPSDPDSHWTREEGKEMFSLDVTKRTSDLRRRRHKYGPLSPPGAQRPRVTASWHGLHTPLPEVPGSRGTRIPPQAASVPPVVSDGSVLCAKSGRPLREHGGPAL